MADADMETARYLLLEIFRTAGRKEMESLIAAALESTRAEERGRCAKIVTGWREADWPEGFDRRTAEILAEDRVSRIRTPTGGA